MARKRRKASADAGELNLVAMIDVAFQLLSFFVMTAHPVDVLTNLDVFRPVPSKTQDKKTPPPPVLRITVAYEAYLVNDVPVDFARMEDFVKKMAAADPTQTVLIQCDQRAEHRKLVAALDMCSKAKLVNLSVVSTHKVVGQPR
jgi:biopolymer transport protein ExbD